MESSPKLPEWLNNVLATLPPENAVRCLTLPPVHPFRKDHVDRKPEPFEEDSVFAFQAPVGGHRPEEHTKTEGQPRADVSTFRTTHGEPVELHRCCPTTSLACTVPFSTPGPGWTASASCCQPPSSSPPCISRPPTGTGALEILDTPLPFSMPGPFVPVRPTYGHVLDRGPTAPACDAVLPVAGWSGATSFPDPRATKIDRLGSYLPSDQGGNEFLESFSSSPKFILDDAGPPSSLESIPPAVYFGPPIENLSFSATTGSAPACSKDKLMATTPPRSLTWGSPSAVTRPSGVAGDTRPVHAKPAVFLSDIQLDHDLKGLYSAFLLFLYSIEFLTGRLS